MKTNVFNVELIEKQIKENQEREDILAMRFHLWMLENDTEENAERFFHYQRFVATSRRANTYSTFRPFDCNHCYGA